MCNSTRIREPKPKDWLASLWLEVAGCGKWSPSLRLIGRRLLAAVPVLLLASVLAFLVVDLLPGNAARQLAGPEATEEQVARLEAELGLDRPLTERYVSWLTSVLRADFGRSPVSGQPVSSLIADRLPVTLALVVYAFVVALALAIPLALMSARWPGGAVDRMAAVFTMAGVSMANYVLALVLVLLFAVYAGLLPSFGYVPVSGGVAGHLRSLVLPAVSIALPLLCFYARFLRADLIEQLNGQEFVVAAKSRGLGPWRILIRHAMPNSAFGLLTLVGLNFGALVGGTVVIEQIFALPGLGQLLLQAIATRDVVVIQAIVLVLTFITICANLMVDMLYATLDPRIRHGR